MDGFILPLLLILIVLIITFVAIFVIMKANREQRNAPEVTIEAVFQGATSETKEMNQNFTSSTVDSANAYESKQYYATFKAPQKKILKFKVSKRLALSLSDQTIGKLTYRGYKLISFVPTGKVEPKKNTSKK
jgi:uncharacterized protein YxeA